MVYENQYDHGLNPLDDPLLQLKEAGVLVKEPDKSYQNSLDMQKEDKDLIPDYKNV